MTARTFLVTGGAGFLGSHLVERLVSRGDHVIALDNLSTGRRENVETLLDHPRFELFVGNARDRELVGTLVQKADFVVHFAAAVGVKLIVERPVHTVVTNVEATEVVLEAASLAGKQFLLASTSEVYGKSVQVPFREDADVSLGPTSHSRWAYACSKALDEWLALAYQRERGLAVRIVRFFNVVGQRQTGRYGMVLPNFARQALKNEPITVYGDGEQSRCFCNVRDAIDSVLRLADCDDAIGEVTNVGSDEEVTIRQLAERTRDLAQSSSEIVFVPYEEAYAEGFQDMRRRVPDLSKLERLTGRRPTIPLAKTIEEVLDSQAARLSAAG